jgi:hypothetical protein
MRKNLLLFALLLFVIQASAQTRFKKTPSNAFSALAATRDGGYVAIAAGNSSTNGTEVALVKLDSNFEVQWSREYSAPGHDNTDHLMENADGTFMLAGKFANASPAPPLWLTKTDSLGNIIWSKYYEDPNFGLNHIFRLFEAKNGGHVVFGLVFSNFVMMRIDENGNQVWVRNYGSLGPGVAQACYAAQLDDGFVLAFDASSSTSSKGNIQLWRTDTAGVPVWRKRLATPGTDVCHGVAAAPDGGFIVSGNTGSPNPNFAFILKTDSAGVVQWTKVYTGTAAAVGQPQAVPGGGFIFHTTMTLMKTNDSGNVDFVKRYGTTFYTGHMLQTKGGYMLTAVNQYRIDAIGNTSCDYTTHTATDSSITMTDSSLSTAYTTYTLNTQTRSLTSTSRTDSMTTVCSDTVTIPNGIPAGITGSLKVFPNPFSTQTTLEFGNNTVLQAELYDITGRKVRSYSSIHDSNLIISRGELLTGVYFVKVMMQNGSVVNTKILVD